MHHFVIMLRQVISTIRREKIHRIAIFILLVIFLGSTAFAYFEEEVDFGDALWWSIVTMTTVGYGDIFPITTEGRIVGIGVMIMGIGFLGLLLATVAGVIVENRLLEGKGMKPTSATGHFIICGWNFRGEKIVAELRSDSKSSSAPIVVIAEIAEKPVDDQNLHFIRGEVNPETLKKANIESAQVAIVLSDDSLDCYARDAKTILNTMTIKNLCRDIYACVELTDPKNVDHCQMAKADEIIVVGELSTNLLVQAALDHGITRMISELVSNRYGMNLDKIKLPSNLANRTFFEVMSELKEKHGILCVGVEDMDGKNLITNPDSHYKLDKDDQLIIISSERPDIS